MDRDPRAYLWDAREGADAIARFVGGRTLDDHAAIDDRTVWRTVQESLPALRARLATLLDRMDDA
jgi:uncharacterized protein with HEPN domain